MVSWISVCFKHCDLQLADLQLLAGIDFENSFSGGKKNIF
jgi:hypothetical protein